MQHPQTSALGHYYDTVPYTSYAYPESAPEHLSAVAHALGLSACENRNPRALEIGCASGGNLIPFAMRSPGSECIGIDLSEQQIRQGNSLIEKLGLANIRLIQGDFSSLEMEPLGKFDYIVCHGLYSWIPAPMQDSLLALCAGLLSEDGIVYISYNTYPGWKSKEVIRDAMLLHCRSRSLPEERIAYAKAMLGFLRRMTKKGSMIAHMLEESMHMIDRTGDDYLSHDYLEPFNNPCYFEEFTAKSKSHGLCYLAESNIRPMRPENYGREVAEPLLRTFGNDQITMEQYLDFVTNRGFRQTLLVHESRSSLIDHRLRRDRLSSLHFSANLPCRSGTTRNDGTLQEYGLPDGTAFATKNTMLKRTADALTLRWPDTITKDEIVQHALATGAVPTSTQEAGQAENLIDDLLLHLINSGICKIRLHRIAQSSQHELCPTISPLVRSMIHAIAETGSGSITNTWHENVDVTEEEMSAYALMDGSRNIAEIADEVFRKKENASSVPSDFSTRISGMIEKARMNGMLCMLSDMEGI